MSTTSVYLDHLILRENLRYSRPNENEASASAPAPKHGLRLSDLQNPARVKLFRKPDFQRETSAWSTEDCVSLLDSIVNEQVVPSIIMWSSPDSGFDYILDGGHRVSVILAWLTDDWGDGATLSHYVDDQREKSIQDAAQSVRDLVRMKIGTIHDYQEAESAIEQAMLDGKSPQKDLPSLVFKRGLFYQRLLKGHIEFHVLWVPGNYEKAEQSFIKINKSGHELSEWEIKLVTNRNSSFARIVMSIASIASASKYWPIIIPDHPYPNQVQAKAKQIVQRIYLIHNFLFNPPYQERIQSLQQPLMVVSGAQQKPYYLAEFLTVLQGGRGQSAETDKLLSQDRSATPDEILDNGQKIVEQAIEVFEQMIGKTSTSLSLVSTLYFYTESGRYVRSLLYGFVYWMFAGSERDIISRKKVFSAYRSSFEGLLMDTKEDLVSGLTRKTGSGPDITTQTATFFNTMLKLIQAHSGDIQSQAFADAYAELTKKQFSRKTKISPEGKSRSFQGRTRSTIMLQTLLSNPVRCGICKGVLDPSSAVEFDHIKPVAFGGPTIASNGQLAHPFCNNQRPVIELMMQGQQVIQLPVFVDPSLESDKRQLSFFDDPAFNK